MNTVAIDLEQIENDRRRKALMGAILFLMLLVIALFAIKRIYPDPPIPDEQEILITMEASGNAGGSSTSQTTPTESTSSAGQDVVTSDNPSPIVIPPSKGDNTPKPSNTNTNTGSNSSSETTNPDPQPSWDVAFGGGGNGSGTGNSNGDGDDSFGDGAPGPGGNGIEGYGSGRKLLRDADKPNVNNVSGTVVLDVIVRPNGTIKRITLNRSKSTITDPAVVQKCITEAYKMKFEDYRHKTSSDQIYYKPFRFIES